MVLLERKVKDVEEEQKNLEERVLTRKSQSLDVNNHSN